MPNNIIITPGSASIQFSGSANNDTIRLQVEPSGSIAFYGSSGSLFSITDQLSGSLMSVNDISGLPILEVFSDDRVVMGTFNQNTLVVTGSRVGIDKAVPTADLDISGSVFITGSLRVTGSQALNGILQVVSGAISSSGPNSGIYLDSISTNPNLTILADPSHIRYYARNGSHMFRVGNVDALDIAAFSVAPVSDNQATIGTSGVRWGTGFINNIRSSGSITNTGSLNILSGSINIINGGITGSVFGTSSWANSASVAISSSFSTTASTATSLTFTPTTASYALTSSVATSSSFSTSASWAPGVTSITAGEGLTGGTINSTGTIRLDSSSFFFAEGVRIVLDSEGVVTSSTQIDYTQIQNTPVGVISSSTQVDYTQLQNIPSGIISSSTQVDYTQLQNIPSGLVSSSQQINTGSFTGSFTGTLLGTSSWATTASFAVNATTASLATLAQTASYFDGFINFPSGLRITGSLVVTGSQTITGSLNVTRGITGSLLGSSSFATTSSFSTSASWAPGITQLIAGNGLTGGTISSTGTITLDTGSVHFLDGVKKELNTEGVISGSTFSSPSQGTVRAVINGIQTDVDTGLQTGDSPQFTNLNISSAITASIISASTAITASNVRLNGLTDITTTNKVLVLDTATNRIFTTASVGTGGSSGNGFPYDGTVTPAVISGSLIISQSVQNTPALRVTGSVDFRTGSTRVYTSLDDANNGGLFVQNNLTNVFLRVGFNGAVVGTNSTELSISAGGTQRALINSDGILPNSNLGNDLGDSATRWRDLYVGRVSASIGISTPIISASIISSSHVQLVNVVDTTSTNKVLVLDTATNKIFTTASVGGGGGSGNGFPYDGTVTPAVISGSLLISSSHNSPLTISGSTDSFFEVEVVNASAGNNASADFVVSSNNTTDFGNYAAFGINSSTFNGPLVGGPSDAYLYVTSSVGELDFGHAHTGPNSNIRLFTNSPNSTANTRLFISASGNVGIGTTTNLTNLLTVNGNILTNAITGSLTSGSVTNISELSMAVSGTITASGTTGVTLNLNQANYFMVSGSGTGTVTWTVTNAPPAGRVQTFIIEYTNGGIKTNSWFTNTRWPAGVAPTLTSASANPDLLGFTTDDAGANWRGVLLQRGSA